MVPLWTSTHARRRGIGHVPAQSAPRPGHRRCGDCWGRSGTGGLPGRSAGCDGRGRQRRGAPVVQRRRPASLQGRAQVRRCLPDAARAAPGTDLDADAVVAGRGRQGVLHAGDVPDVPGTTVPRRLPGQCHLSRPTRGSSWSTRITCIGSRACMAACPYEARYFNWNEPAPTNRMPAPSPNTPQFPANQIGTVGKCVLCADRSRTATNCRPAWRPARAARTSSATSSRTWR